MNRNRRNTTPCNRNGQLGALEYRVKQLEDVVAQIREVLGLPEDATLGQIREIAAADQNVRTAEQRRPRRHRGIIIPES